jgi:isopentenyl diphosphate isomerase/L-lactate dehydrogenase-like FMN-dependent dehydrogenase
VKLFGVTHSSPVLIAPIGVNGIFAKEGEFAAAGAGAKLGVPFILSTAASRSIEDVAAVNGDGYRWYQLYWYATAFIFSIQFWLKRCLQAKIR